MTEDEYYDFWEEYEDPFHYECPLCGNWYCVEDHTDCPFCFG